MTGQSLTGVLPPGKAFQPGMSGEPESRKLVKLGGKLGDWEMTGTAGRQGVS